MRIYKAEHLDSVFRQVSRMHHQAVSALLAGKGVYPGQPPLLRALAEQDGQIQKELAEKMSITPATLNVMIGRMEKAGLVERRSDPADQRISRVYITEAGRAANQSLRDVLDWMETTCFENFTMEERVIFRRLLLQMYENLKKADIDGDRCAPKD